MNEVVRSFVHVLRSNVRYLWILCLLLAGLPFLAAAQEATIVGTVTDPAGSVVPNVTITVTNTGTGYIRTFTTNDVGQYVAPSLPIGKYDLKAESSGFKIEESKGVVLNVNDRTRIDFQMKMGTKSETVSVEANTIQVQADSSEQSNLISGTQISQLATNGRSIYTYVTLTTGASNLMPDFEVATPAGGNSDISFNGNRPGHNLYLLDGGENSDRGGAGGSSVMPSVDAIAETQTLTSNYTADYGLSSGGTVSSAIKSGTKAFHASAWEFFRNDALDARNFFNSAPQPVAELRYNVFGFNVGGPVTFGKLYNPNRTKTFFFYNMEWRRLIQGQTLNQTVPLASTYGGDFSAVAPTLAKLHAPFSCQLAPSIQAQFGAAGQALSGCTAGAPDTTKEVAFNGNAIPTALLDPNAQALLTAGGKYGGIFPAPTNGTQFQGGNNVPTNVREEVVRIDENVNDKFTIYGHFVAEQIAQNYGITMWSGDNVPTISNTFGNPSYAAVVHTAYVISPTLINEASFNYNGNRIAIQPLGLVSAPASFTFNRFFTGPNVDDRIPTINLNGSTGAQYTSNWTPWNNKADDYQIRDDVSWTKGRHQLKMGGSWAWYGKTQDWFKNTQGGFNFNGSYTGNDFADYLLGYGQGYTEDAVKSSGQWNNVSWALYIQDNYRVNSRLTLNLGLRWDGIPHTYEANNQMSNFYPGLYNPANAAVLNPGQQTISPLSPGLGPSPNPILAGQQFYLNGIGVCNVGGVPKGCVNNSWANFGPRLGFAYDVRGDGKTVIRGGYGIMYERIQGNDVYNNAGTVPFSASTSFNNVSLSDPKTSLSTGLTIPASIPVNNITGLDKNNYTSPRSTQFSLGVQQAIGKSVLSVSYVGSQNRHQSYYSETDLPLQSDLADLQAHSGPYNSLVPYLGYHSIKMAQNEANGDYNSLQAAIRGTLAKNDLNYSLGYTYSHTNDSFGSSGCGAGGDLCPISNPYLGWKYDFGPSDYDRQNIFFANFVYQIPLLKNSDNKLLKTTLGGWEVAGIITAQSGAPLNIGVTGQNVTSVVPNTANRPDLIGSLHNPHTVNEWFDSSLSVWANPAPGAWGNTPHNFVRGPGRDNWNLSLYKNFVFTESSYLQFRAEFFNVWNHTQFQGDTRQGGISTNLGATNFGAVTNAYDPRVIQLALKLFF
jgi:Carboxypeptidase regulatory-like domain